VKKLLGSQPVVCIAYPDGHALECKRTSLEMDLDQEPATTCSCEAWNRLGNTNEKESLTY